MVTKFQQRHYEAIASVLQQIRTEATTWDSAFGREVLGGVPFIVQRLSEMFMVDNPRFDRGRFARACVPGAWLLFDLESDERALISRRSM